MSDLPVPAVLAILLLVLLVLIVLIVVGLRGRRDAPEAAPPEAESARAGASSTGPHDAPTSDGDSAESADHAAARLDGAGPDGPVPASADHRSAEPSGAEPDVAGSAASPSPADDDPRPWRERHGRRASRPLLSELSAAESADEPPAAAGAAEGVEAESWEVSPEEPAGRGS